MALIPINIKEGTLRKEEFIVGIDLGTTNSLVAVAGKNGVSPKAIPGNDREVIVPSLLHLGPNREIQVGNAARPFLISDPENTIFSVKRLMGRSYRDVKGSRLGYRIIDDQTDSLVKIQAGDAFYTPVELSSFILKELKVMAEAVLDAEVTKAVITVPAYFNDAQRQATRDAGKLAGLDVLRIVNEPTAASLAYGLGLDPAEQKTIAVYDLGGGTFDISILSIHDGIFEVLATHGDTWLGGDDMDRAILENWMETVPGLAEFTGEDKSRYNAIRLLAEEAKKKLGKQPEFSAMLEDKFELNLDRDTMNRLILPVVEKTLESCKMAMKDSGLTTEQIDEVVMVGGSTRVQLVLDKVKDFFRKEQVNNSLDPDEVVALGAAVEADILAGNRKDILLLDVTPLSLGIETLGGLMDVIIPRNSKVPQKAGRQYTTSVDGQTNMRITIYQGERDSVEHNRKLGEFNLTGIPAMPAGLPKIEITFMLDADGILNVSACELRSGVEQTIEVKPQYGLTDEELEKMLLDSLKNAKQDMDFRALKEAVTEAEQLIYTTLRFIEKNTTELTETERQDTVRLVDTLRETLTSDDKDVILKAHEALNDFTRPFAERLMDKAIGQAMRGKRVEEA